MHKNRYWLSFLAVVSLSTAYFSILAAHALQTYFSLTAQAAPLETAWRYEKGSRARLVPIGSYRFVAKGRSYSATSSLQARAFLSPAAAKEVLAKLKNERHTVWYNPEHPQRSTLQKLFPLKELLSALTLLGVFFYLVYLGCRVSQQSAK